MTPEKAVAQLIKSVTREIIEYIIFPLLCPTQIPKKDKPSIIIPVIKYGVVIYCPNIYLKIGKPRINIWKMSSKNLKILSMPPPV